MYAEYTLGFLFIYFLKGIQNIQLILYNHNQVKLDILNTEYLVWLASYHQKFLSKNVS